MNGTSKNKQSFFRQICGRVRAKGIGAGLAAAMTFASGASAVGQAYKVNNIVSDGSVPAAVVDTNFINPWAISTSGNWWISTAGTGYNYVIPATTGTVSFKVIVPLGATPTVNGLPSGSVATSGATGMLLSNGAIASFLFSTLDGTISGWNARLGTNNALSQIVINNSASGAAYTGLALLNTGGGSYLLAPNFATNTVEVYDSNFKPAKLAGSFSDPGLPADYAAYGIHILNNQVFVTYAKRTATKPFREVVDSGAGIVDVFDNTGALVTRAITGGTLNAPWGVAYAPANFGIYSNALLVGNFGDGIINAFDPKTYTYLGQLMDSTGKPLMYAALWELLTGGTKITNSTAVSGGDVNTVYFTAGLTDEKHGLLGGITSGSVAGSSPLFSFTTASHALTLKAGASGSVAMSIAPVNGFSGNVSLSCSGLPVGASCTFSPAQVTVSPTAVSQVSVSIQTSGTSASNVRPLRGGTALALAFAMPLCSFVLFRRKRIVAMRLLGAGAVLFVLGSLSGCGDSATVTPVGATQVVLTAASGSQTQQSSVYVYVQ